LDGEDRKMNLDWITEIGPKHIKDFQGVWHVKDVDHVTIAKADKIEDKLEILREVVNYLLEDRYGNN
jgi:hypothetical protein